MGTKIRFTTWDTRKCYRSLMALSPAEAYNKAGGYVDLIIQGTAKDIGAVSGERLEGDTRERVKIGAVCTVEAGYACRAKKVVIKDATYQGRKMIGEYSFCTFTKNGVTFWICDPYFVFIDGKRIYWYT